VLLADLGLKYVDDLESIIHYNAVNTFILLFVYTRIISALRFETKKISKNQRWNCAGSVAARF
jgi:hypothetical protein